MSRATRFGAAAVLVAAAFAGCAESKTDGATATGGPEATAEATAPVPTASAAPAETAAATAAPTASADASAAAAAAASGAPSATAVAGTATAAASAAAGAKTYDCGAKGQKACPMQGWMKSVMGSASQSGDGAKLAAALTTVAGKPPPGMGQWVSIANAAKAKAQAGDIEGAKKACEQCHALYKDRYKKTMRDRPW